MGRAQERLRYGAPYWPGRLSCGSDWRTCIDKLLSGLGHCCLLLNKKGIKVKNLYIRTLQKGQFTLKKNNKENNVPLYFL